MDEKIKFCDVCCQEKQDDDLVELRPATFSEFVGSILICHECYERLSGFEFTRVR